MNRRFEVALYMSDEPALAVVVTTRVRFSDALEVASMLCGKKWKRIAGDCYQFQLSSQTTLNCVVRPQDRSDLEDEGMEFWLQTKAPAGNWVDSLGCADIFSCINHGKWFVEQKHYDENSVRVVRRINVPKWTPKKGE